MFALVLFKNDKFRWPLTLFNMLKFGKKRAGTKALTLYVTVFGSFDVTYMLTISFQNQ